MKIIGCDFHPGYQQIAMVDTETGEFTERRLSHGNDGEEVRKFYAGLSATVGPHQQAREFLCARTVGGSGAECGAL
jgi:hypothetical protein